MERKAFSLLVMLLCLGWGFSMTAMAQDPAKIWLRDGPHRLLDTPEIMEQMDIARQLAGDDYYYLRNKLRYRYTVHIRMPASYDLCSMTCCMGKIFNGYACI